MSREIKFRAWDKITKQLVYLNKSTFVNYEVDDKNIGFELTLDGLGKESNQKTWLRKPKDYVLQQFTGLKDKNGREIYEGDILKSVTKNIYSIEFNYGKFILNGNYCDEMYDFNCSEYRDGQNSSERFEIVGNIFENKDLL